MTSRPTFSVIVASRGRAESLRRTVCAVLQLDYPEFEVLVVGDPGAMRVVAELGATGIRAIPFDVANLSAARNKGVELSAGTFCAFIDDDAVPEPMWLHHHSRALEQTGADACVGYVRGPNGIVFQSQISTIDDFGETRDQTPQSDIGHVPVFSSGSLKLVGTNMVVRRDALLALGGFDEAFRYYLEDSDLSLRLSLAGYMLAVAPLAEVHHALDPSERRGARRVPLSLFDIGRSSAIYLRRHRGEAQAEDLKKLLMRERRRLIRFMIRGDIEPKDVEALLKGLRDGWMEGTSVSLAKTSLSDAQPSSLSRIAVKAAANRVMTCRLLGRRKTISLAKRAARTDSQRMTVVSYSLTAFPRHVYFSEGVWCHTGGQFWAGTRQYLRFKWCRFAKCVSEELARVAKQRGLNDVRHAWCGGARPTVGSVCVNVQEKGDVIS